MNISKRAQNMPQSPIRKLAKYAEAAKRNGVHIYSLNIGQPDIKTPQCALDAVGHFQQDILEYSPSQGGISLRAKMVQYYAEYLTILPMRISTTLSRTYPRSSKSSEI